RLISEVRRVLLEKFGRIGEVVAPFHGIDLNFRRRLHVDSRIDLHFDRFGRFAPLRQWCDLVTGLNFVNSIVIRRTVSFGAANNPDVAGRRFDWRSSCRYDPAPAAWRDEKISRLRSGRTPT